VIVPAYNAGDTLDVCLSALCSQTLAAEDVEIIVVDDGSTDHTPQIARSYGVRLIQQPNAGPAAARNQGAAQAQGEILLFTDADCAPAEDWIAQMVAPFTDPSIAGVRGIYCTRQRSLVARFVQLEYESRYGRLQSGQEIDFVDTYSAGYRRALWAESGGFDETFRTASVEDQEFSFRLVRAGHRLVFVPQAVVYHQHDRTVGEYWWRKFGIGYGKARVLRRYPERVVSDSHTPQALKAQIVFLGLGLLSLPAAIGWVPARWVLLISSLFFLLAAIPLLVRIARDDPPVLVVAPVLLVVRALALGSGLCLGVVMSARKEKASR
jgi:cellulose synthase/poly-beta-1,6-N-acetylglucosamine synthase-like glycosyltransferase